MQHTGCSGRSAQHSVHSTGRVGHLKVLVPSDLAPMACLLAGYEQGGGTSDMPCQVSMASQQPSQLAVQAFCVQQWPSHIYEPNSLQSIKLIRAGASARPSARTAQAAAQLHEKKTTLVPYLFVGWWGVHVAVVKLKANSKQHQWGTVIVWVHVCRRPVMWPLGYSCWCDTSASD